MAICDRCERNIPHGQGYLFYSTARIGIPGRMNEIGTLLYCDNCTLDICNEREFSKSAQPPKKFNVDSNDYNRTYKNLIGGTREAINSGIVQACKHHGLTPEDARKKAQELSLLWWQNEEHGEITARKFWTSKPTVSLKRLKNSWKKIFG